MLMSWIGEGKMTEKIDWTREASEALTYFSRLGISLDSIEAMIEETYEKVNRSYAGSFTDAVDSEFRNRLVERLGENTEDIESRIRQKSAIEYGITLSKACLFYCYDRIIDEKKYRNFYDFLEQCRRELQN